jgi:hypothetical protein
MAANTRPVCWPDPDLVCADGGCVHCQDSKTRRGRVAIARAVGRGVRAYQVWMPGQAPGRIPLSVLREAPTDPVTASPSSPQPHPTTPS